VSRQEDNFLAAQVFDFDIFKGCKMIAIVNRKRREASGLNTGGPKYENTDFKSGTRRGQPICSPGQTSLR
jgi:hypothetical protein